MNIKRLFLSGIMTFSILLGACSNNTNSDSVIELQDSASADDEISTNKIVELLAPNDFALDETLAKFNEETGIMVNVTTFDSDEEMLTLIDNDEQFFDLAIGSGSITDIAIRNELVQKLDLSKFSNQANINPAYQGLYYDVSSEYTVPFLASSPMIVYSTTLDTLWPDSLHDLWENTADKTLVFPADSREVLGISLYTMGQDINTTNSSIINIALEQLSIIEPRIAGFMVNEPQEVLLQNQADIAYMQSSDAFKLLQQDDQYVAVYPAENEKLGPIVRMELLFIPSHASNPTDAMQLINYLIKDDISASVSQHLGYWSCNTNANEFYLDEMKDNMFLTGQSHLLPQIQLFENVGDASTVYDDAASLLTNDKVYVVVDEEGLKQIYRKSFYDDLQEQQTTTNASSSETNPTSPSVEPSTDSVATSSDTGSITNASPSEAEATTTDETISNAQ